MLDVVIFSTADWSNPFWTNKQHVASNLAHLGHRVLYIDSVGLRRPSLSSQDMGRIWKRLRSFFAGARQVRENLWVWSPIVLPFQQYKVVRFFNKVVLSVGIAFLRWRLGIKNPLLWTYNPLTLNLISTSAYRFVVYHCVDEIKAQPGMPAEQISRADEELTRAANVVFVTSEDLLQSRRVLNPAVHYFSNVADYAHFSKAQDPALPLPDDLKKFKAPIIGFVGAISGYKVDFDLMRLLSDRLPHVNIIMIGKVGEGDPWTDVSELQKRSNIHLIGPRDYADLPAYLKAFDVCLLPCKLNEYTKAMFPMKFFEYIAAGRPVVSTNLHALRGHSDVAVIAKDNQAFVDGVVAALEGKGPSLDVRLAKAKEMTYEKRTAKMLGVIASLLK